MLEIIRNRPAFLSDTHLTQAAALLAESGLSTRDALARIKRQFLVLLGLQDGSPLAVLTVKKPDKAYVTDVFRRAGVVLGNHSLELGYLYAKRGSAAAWPGTRMYRLAMEAVRRTNTGLYCTTRADAETLNRYLTRGGWHRSAAFRSTKGPYDLLLWTMDAQQPVRPPTVRHTGIVTSSGTVIVPRDMVGKRVTVTVIG